MHSLFYYNERMPYFSHVSILMIRSKNESRRLPKIQTDLESWKYDDK